MTCPIMKKNVRELSLAELGTIEGLVHSELRALAAGKQPVMPDGSAWPANLTNYQEMLEQVLVVAAEASELLTTAPPAPAPDPLDDVPAAIKEVAAAISWRANIPGFFRFHVAYEWGADTYTVRLWRAIDPKLNNGKLGELIREEHDVYCDMLDGTIDRMYIAGCNQYNAHAIDLDSPIWVPLPNPQLPTRSSRAVTSRTKYN